MSGGTSRRLVDLHPEGARALERLQAAAWDAADSSLLELCSRRVAELLGNEVAADAGPPAGDADFTTAERAHLEFTEQFVTSVSDVSSEQVDALLAHGSAEAVRSLVAALYVVELSQRVDMVARVVLSPRGRSHE